MPPMTVLSVVPHVIAAMVRRAANAMTGGTARLVHPVRHVSATRMTVPDRLAARGFRRRASRVWNVLHRNPGVSPRRVLNGLSCRLK